MMLKHGSYYNGKFKIKNINEIELFYKQIFIYYNM